MQVFASQGHVVCWEKILCWKIIELSCFVALPAWLAGLLAAPENTKTHPEGLKLSLMHCLICLGTSELVYFTPHNQNPKAWKKREETLKMYHKHGQESWYYTLTPKTRAQKPQKQECRINTKSTHPKTTAKSLNAEVTKKLLFVVSQALQWELFTNHHHACGAQTLGNRVFCDTRAMWLWYFTTKQFLYDFVLCFPSKHHFLCHGYGSFELGRMLGWHLFLVWILYVSCFASEKQHGPNNQMYGPKKQLQ